MKLLKVVYQETAEWHFKWYLARIVLTPFPINVMGRLRTRLMRAVGFRIGRTTVFSQTPTLQGGGGDLYNKLVIGEKCYINTDVFFDLSDHITLGNRIAVGHQVIFLTTSHDASHPHKRGGDLLSAPIYVGDGAWIAARATILPGVTVGEGAIVAAGAVVTKDVPPHTLVGGIPAKPIRALSQVGISNAERNQLDALLDGKVTVHPHRVSGIKFPDTV